MICERDDKIRRGSGNKNKSALPRKWLKIADDFGLVYVMGIINYHKRASIEGVTVIPFDI